ncbi:MAG: hypothetical protein ACRYG2_38090 [Janthinobacterium lividum]
MYSARAGGAQRDTALATVQTLDQRWIDDGDSRAYLLAWLMTRKPWAAWEARRMRHRGTWPTAALGVVLVVVGLLVLRSPGAQASFGWFSYGPPSQEVLDGVVAWNLVRAVGAVLVLIGLLVLGQLLGRAASRRSGGRAAQLARPVLVLAGVLVLGGLVAFFAVDAIGRSEATVSISKVTGSAHLMVGPGVWTQDRFAAALVAATGLVVAAVGLGLRRGYAP